MLMFYGEFLEKADKANAFQGHLQQTIIAPAPNLLLMRVGRGREETGGGGRAGRR